MVAQKFYNYNVSNVRKQYELIICTCENFHFTKKYSKNYF